MINEQYNRHIINTNNTKNLMIIVHAVHIIIYRGVEMTAYFEKNVYVKSLRK